MGNCVSTNDKEASARSQEIDRQIEEDSKKFKKECKILLLGSGESGKSTIVKQMKIIHHNGYKEDSERLLFKLTIYRNLLESAKNVLLAMRKISVDCANPRNRAMADRILDYEVDASTSFVFSEEVAIAIYDLWTDPIIPTIMDHSSEFYLMDSASYFFTEAKRIGDPNYVPNVTDVLRARQKSTGITETRFTLGPLSIHMFDVGGQRSERKKWIHCFESVTSIIFCTALSEYDQNRMAESLILFDSVINSRWFLRTSIILFLNKIDVFKNKLPKVPLERYFPEYTGGADINKAAKYILWRFMQANRARLSVYPQYVRSDIPLVTSSLHLGSLSLTQATDTSNIRLVFAAVKETILQNALKDSGIL
ncbi:hypothetical protein NLI96_g11417 [Meripilus lineatus]|uniref:Guanine nucleotide-binding protein subunit alpha n=1 Tax=Meripilus lineatus TaxID=2056292 RepID=A0AAD5UWP6_9APHY|nr:hypothetical protein NLI96_g11417 [Physisporinus lineatus]